MLDRGVPAGINPLTVACLMLVVSVKMKSSAVSVSSLDGLLGWDNDPSLPSALPVLKKNESALSRVPNPTALISVTATKNRRTVICVLHHVDGMKI